MKTRLEQLTVSQFADLLCGDTSVLMEGKKERPLKADVEKAVRGILLEYREIADPSGMRAYLLRMEELVKARTTIQMMRICSELIRYGRHSMVRGILSEIGVSAERMSDARVEAEVQSQIGRANSTVSEIEGELTLESASRDGADVRRQFDSQTAALMGHFKFQIDPGAMKATLYAHLVARYAREMKAIERSSMRK